MTKVMVAAISALLLSGCLTSPTEPVSAIPSPVCTSERQCDAMWAAAQDWVAHVGGMRVARVSRDSIATFLRAPEDTTTMSGTVTRQPLNDGSYQLVARFECRNRELSCASLETSGVNLFNTMVSAAGEGSDR